MRTRHPLTSDHEAELEGLLLAWRLQVSHLGKVTPQTALSREAYHTSVGMYDAYQYALELVGIYDPRTKSVCKNAIQKELRTAKATAVRKFHEARTEPEQWQAQGRKEAYEVILA